MKRPSIAIIDYGAGNLRSVIQAFEYVGGRPEPTSDSNQVLAADMVVFPGVGNGEAVMQRLRRRGLVRCLRQVITENRPYFGICLGLQLLFQETEEGNTRSLNLFEGTVRRFPPGLKVPHMGWNDVSQCVEHPLFDGVPQASQFYFVHSYYPDPQDPSPIAAKTEYGITFPSMLIKGNLVATQFHPEKSGDLGLRMYRNFLKLGGQGVS